LKLNRTAIPFIFDVPAYHVTRRLTILIDQPWNELSEEARTTLYKLIQAVHIPYHQVPVIHRNSMGKDEVQVLNSAFIISFGVSADSCTNPYHLYQIGDTAFVLADNLNVFSSDKNLKQKLWQLLLHKFGQA
jgi:hypothetical protein